MPCPPLSSMSATDMSATAILRFCAVLTFLRRARRGRRPAGERMACASPRLMRAINGLAPATSGQVSLDGMQIIGAPARHCARPAAGWATSVPAIPILSSPALSAFQNVLFGVMGQRTPGRPEHASNLVAAARDRAAARWIGLDRWDLPTARTNRPTGIVRRPAANGGRDRAHAHLQTTIHWWWRRT